MTSESIFIDLVEQAPVGLLVLADAKVVYTNRRFLEITGYDRQELLGTEIANLIHQEDVQSALQRFRERLESRNTLQPTTLRYIRKDGEIRWVEAAGSRIEWDGSHAIMYFIYDVTERKSIETQLAQANKMDAIGRLAGGIAHDFSNVLQVILACRAQLREHTDNEKELEQDISVIEGATRKAASLTKQLLSFSRKHVSQSKVLDLSDVVRKNGRMLQRILGEDIDLRVSAPEGAINVKFDEDQMQQVIMNLAANARDAMPGGGTLSISVRGTGQEVELSFADTGVGMDEATQSRLFEPFFTTKEQGKGTGLGLSIVYGIVKQNGGRILVHSKAGEGSRFSISLPTVERAIDDHAAPIRHEEQTGSGTILVVEDEAVVRKLVRDMLQKFGYAVTEAESGERALEICRSVGRRFDLLLTDLVMPGMKGTEVASKVRQLHPETRVVLMTGYSAAEVARECKDYTVLHKPFDPSALLAAVRRCLSA